MEFHTDPDESRWREPFIAAYRQVWDAPHWHPVDREEVRKKADHAFHPRSDFVLAVKDGTVAGFAWAWPFAHTAKSMPDVEPFTGIAPEDTAYLESIGVIPARRGNRIGTRLLTRLLRTVKKVYSTAVLRTTQDAPAAVALYQKHGFHDTGVQDPDEPGRTFFVKKL